MLRGFLLGGFLFLLLWLHLHVSGWVTFCGSFSGWLGYLDGLDRCGNILLDWNLLLLSPLFLEIRGLENGDLMDVVADSQDKGHLIIVLLLAFLDYVARYLAGESR